MLRIEQNTATDRLRGDIYGKMAQSEDYNDI